MSVVSICGKLHVESPINKLSVNSKHLNKQTPSSFPLTSRILILANHVFYLDLSALCMNEEHERLGHQTRRQGGRGSRAFDVTPSGMATGLDMLFNSQAD